MTTTDAHFRMATTPCVSCGPDKADQSLLEVQPSQCKEIRLSAEMQWFEKAVHRFVASGIYLLGGQPGARKSGLALQLALDRARQNMPCLFILNEEPASRLRERALLLTRKWPA